MDTCECPQLGHVGRGEDILRNDKQVGMANCNLALLLTPPGLLTRTNRAFLEREGRGPPDCNRSTVHVPKHLRDIQSTADVSSVGIFKSFSQRSSLSFSPVQ